MLREVLSGVDVWMGLLELSHWIALMTVVYTVNRLVAFVEGDQDHR